MKIKELIEQLQKYDENLDIMFYELDETCSAMSVAGGYKIVEVVDISLKGIRTEYAWIEPKRKYKKLVEYRPSAGKPDAILIDINNTWEDG